MPRKSKTQHLTVGILGQHLALSVAAGLARTQLIPEPLKVYDAQHLSETMDVIARALAKVAPVYAQDAQGGVPRELSPAELEGAEVRRGATVVVLKDGRKLSGVSIKRADLRQAVAILKAVGIRELTPPPSPAAAAPKQTFDAPSRVAEIERLLRPPLVRTQAEEANRLAVALARHVPYGRVANLAMQLISAVHEALGDEASGASRIALVLVRLRQAVEEVANTQ